MGAKSARERGRRVDRLPRRGTDRVDDAVAWLLVAAGVLAAVLIGSASSAVHRAGMERAAVESTDRHRVPVELVLRGAPAPGRYETQLGRMPVSGTTPVPVVPGQPHAPTVRPVMIWVDAHGRPTLPPTTPAAATQAAVAAAVGLSAAAVLVLVGVFVGVRATTARLNEARWEREWAQVGPRWSREVQ